MKHLETVHIVQFSFFEAESFESRGNLTLLGPNGVGKTSILDAVQIAMLGAHGTYVAYNSQSVSSKQRRTLRDYCLGAMHSTEDSVGEPATARDTGRALVRKRDHAQSYITLIFRDTDTGEPVSAGVSLSATILEPDHRLLGLYVAPGVDLSLKDHLQAVEEGDVPLDWGTFEIELQRRAKAVGRTPYISTHPEAYVDELLHALQPAARHIDRHAFIRAFKKSMQLKDIENVNDFVRDYLVDSQPINMQTALAQITRFKNLRALIQDTEEQIERLGQIHKDQKALLDAHRRRDTIAAVRARFELELAEQEVRQLRNGLTNIEQELQQLEPEIARLDKEKRQLFQEIQALVQTISRDPASANLESNKQLHTALTARLRENQRRIDAWHLQLRESLQAIRDAFDESDSDIIQSAADLLEKLDVLASAGTAAEASVLKESIERLRLLQAPIAEKLEAARSAETVASGSLRSLLGQAKIVAQGAGKPSDSVGAAISIFQEHNIEAQPVSALVQVTDSTWQGAIEAFLGRNRESLVVARGKERLAVQLLRQYRAEAEWMYDVTIVQPAHLSVEKHRKPANDLVAAIISGSDEIAVTYVRQLLGDMRRVQTEAELERHPRALTADGMMSANGGTRRLRLPDAKQIRLGARLSSTQQKELYEAVGRAKEDQARCEQSRRRIGDAHDKIRETLKSVELQSYAEVAAAVRSTRDQMAALPDPTTISEPEHLVELRKTKEKTESLYNEVSKKLQELAERRAAQDATAEERRSGIKQAVERVTELGNGHVRAKQAEDFDTEIEKVLYHEVSANQERALMLSACDMIYAKAADRVRVLQNRVFPAFSEFVDHYNVSLIEERTDWRKAMGWVEARKTKLETSELVTYKHDADEALDAAQDAFRQDIAYRLREAIHRLEDGIRQLNKVLKACPLFSGNERYEFVAQPAKTHEKIYRFIANIDSWDGGTSLFAGTDDARQEILDLLEASASPDAKRVQNPLEDYRLLYNFDLAIYQGDHRVDWLSRRIGVASNGEHRVPFYVIAGAALAAAYRLQAGKRHDGAALMLLDEAFYGMDSQNSYATAQFLRSLGLQLVMAGPEADQGKLAPMTDSLYEFVRYDADVFHDVTHFTEKLQQLMTSDMPMLNPQLVDAAEQALLSRKA